MNNAGYFFAYCSLYGELSRVRIRLDPRFRLQNGPMRRRIRRGLHQEMLKCVHKLCCQCPASNPRHVVDLNIAPCRMYSEDQSAHSCRCCTHSRWTSTTEYSINLLANRPLSCDHVAGKFSCDEGLTPQQFFFSCLERCQCLVCLYKQQRERPNPMPKNSRNHTSDQK